MDTRNTTPGFILTGNKAGEDMNSEGIYDIDDFFAARADHQSPQPEDTNTTLPVNKPIALGARSSKYTIALHEKYQSLRIAQPKFTFRGSSDFGWEGEVSVPGLDDRLQGIRDGKRYTSKQEAKERLSEKALEILTRLEASGQFKKAAASQSRGPGYSAALHEKHQKLGISKPLFTYSGGVDLGWSAEVSFPGLDAVSPLQLDGRYLSKQLAKEALSERALEALERAEQQGELGAKRGDGSGPNHSGQLLEFQRAIGGPVPTYSEYAVGNRFTCLVKIDRDGRLPESFGDLKILHSSKKFARQEAARHAVEYFRAQGLWPDSFTSVGGIKKKQRPRLDPPELLSPTASPHVGGQASVASSTLETSYAQQAARLAVILSLPTPEWRYQPSSIDREFYTVQCFFNGAGPHQGPVGEVRNVFGKKKAKEECARLTLDYLREVHAHRLASGQEMLKDISGATDFVEGALGKPTDEDKVDISDKEQLLKDMEGDGDEEEQFEDAVEDLKA
ncbi:hypothetical protein FB567DRAFT_471912 [Paraphoma chrysanthemicola]|uniref:DRBM domain-containing protein n=1 Tax=Paraphoma chrysanthemicola TaxID=798071 RepID=A0A8K0R6D1_9PLEO|nr:hypothetical protein FB567DRAFT_471912 [Paraphoma chrysanthemicola]